MLLVKTANGQVEQFPYTLGDLRRDNPQTSFPESIPDDLLASYDVYPYTRPAVPEYDSLSHRLTDGAFEQVDGAWFLPYVVEQLPQEQAERNIRSRRDSLLKETDWVVIMHTERGTNISMEWEVYRQALHPEFPTGSLIEFKSGTGIKWASTAYTGSPIVTYAFKNTEGFFQVIKYSGDGTSERLISHNLACEWGWAIIKQRNDTNSDHNWVLLSSALGADEGRSDIMLRPNTSSSWDSYWFGDATGSTANSNKTTAINVRNFDYGGTNLPGNSSGVDYVMFVWAHNPTNGIFCGVFDTDASGNYTHIGIGFQPRFGIFKDINNNNADYLVLSTESGWGAGNDTVWDLNNRDQAASVDYGAPTSTGFTFSGTASTRYVFMVII